MKKKFLPILVIFALIVLCSALAACSLNDIFPDDGYAKRSAISGKYYSYEKVETEPDYGPTYDYGKSDYGSKSDYGTAYDYGKSDYGTEKVDLERCSDVKEKQIKVGDMGTMNVRYDDCYPFALVDGEFGAIEDIPEHAAEAEREAVLAQAKKLSDNFYALMNALNVPTDGTAYVESLGDNETLIQQYSEFCSLGTEGLYSMSRMSDYVEGKYDNSLLIGANYRYAIGLETIARMLPMPSDDGDESVYDMLVEQMQIYALFGFKSRDEFVRCAQKTAEIYAEYAKNPTSERSALVNGCFYDSENKSFIFPVVAKTDDCSTFMFIIVDGNGRVSIWMNDFVSWVSSLYGGIVENDLYCKNALFAREDAEQDPEPQDPSEPQVNVTEQERNWILLKDGKFMTWDGKNGKYYLDGDEIVLKTVYAGEEANYRSGWYIDGVLSINTTTDGDTYEDYYTKTYTGEKNYYRWSNIKATLSLRSTAVAENAENQQSGLVAAQINKAESYVKEYLDGIGAKNYNVKYVNLMGTHFLEVRQKLLIKDDRTDETDVLSALSTLLDKVDYLFGIRYEGKQLFTEEDITEFTEREAAISTSKELRATIEAIGDDGEIDMYLGEYPLFTMSKSECISRNENGTRYYFDFAKQEDENYETFMQTMCAMVKCRTELRIAGVKLSISST